MTMEAELTWTQGLQFVGRPTDGPAVILDNPESGSGASPMEMLLMGVAGCTAMDVISILKKKRADVINFRVNITGERDEGHPKRFTSIKLEYVVHGKDIKSADVERAIELSTTKYCGGIASVNGDVTHTYRIEAP